MNTSATEPSRGEIAAHTRVPPKAALIRGEAAVGWLPAPARELGALGQVIPPWQP